MSKALLWIVKRNLAVALRVNVWALALLSLSGCASTLTSALYSTLKSANGQMHNVHLDSAQPPYHVTSTSTLRYHSVEHKTDFRSLLTISRGRYDNWSWVVMGTSRVDTSWNVWRTREAHLTIDSPAARQSSIVMNWDYGFSTLWHVTAYLIGGDPPPVSIRLTLLPAHTNYRSAVTLAGATAVPFSIAMWYPVTNRATPSEAKARFHAYAHALVAVSEALEQVDFALGVLPRPAAQPYRRIKNQLNALCWGVASGVAVTTGTRMSYYVPLHDISEQSIRIFRKVYDHHPNSETAERAYVIALLFSNIRQFFEYQSLHWPLTGRDKPGINGLMSYCRALTHYAGDIRKNAAPVVDRARLSSPFIQ